MGLRQKISVLQQGGLYLLLCAIGDEKPVNLFTFTPVLKQNNQALDSLYIDHVITNRTRIIAHLQPSGIPKKSFAFRPVHGSGCLCGNAYCHSANYRL